MKKESLFVILLTLTLMGRSEVLNPYAAVDWESVEYIHSFTHQHLAIARLEDAWTMGYRHLPISNYYPSKPLYPLPADFLAKHPEALGGPNGEQHSLTDSSIHFNVVGSHYTTGYGETPRVDRGKSPMEHAFKNLNIFDPNHEPWRGYYRLDLNYVAVDSAKASPALRMTVDGAVQIAYKDFQPTAGGGVIDRRELDEKSPRSILLRTGKDTITVRVEFDPAITKITQFRLMQGIHRPWQDAFRAALDGTLKDSAGNPIEGMLFADGGGITINHPTVNAPYLCKLLDFDPRVLGIEVWNQHEFFGGTTMDKAVLHPFYTRWDEVLRTGRRCWGFFVKDHCLYGRGRNVLLMTPGGSVAEREQRAMRAYREGLFFGSIGAMTLNEAGKAVQPYDYSEFRFTALRLREQAGKPHGVEVSVTGANATLRPNTQIRFVTDSGVAQVSDSSSAYFTLPLTTDGLPQCKYVRIEAFAYPTTLANGTPISAAKFTELDVFQIATLHNTRSQDSGMVHMYEALREGVPMGIADMIFSQAIMFK